MKKLATSVITIIIIISLFGCANDMGEPVAGNQAEASQKPGETAGNRAETTQKPSERAGDGSIRIDNETEYVFGGSSPKYGPGFYKENVKHLENDSDVIIKATVLSSKNPDPEAIRDMPIGDIKPEDVHITLTTVRIDEVIKSDKELEGVNETIVDETYRARVGAENVIYIDSIGEALPMKQGSQYLLFLTRIKPDAVVRYGGEFYITGAFQGKYVINQKTQNATKISELTYEDLEFWDYMEKNDLENLKTLAEQVYTKYIW